MPITWTDTRSGEPIHLSLAAGTLTLSLAGHTNLSFDGEGRLVGAWLDGITYRRTLDNRVQMKWVADRGAGVRSRKMLDDIERQALIARAYETALIVHRGLHRGRVSHNGTPPAKVIEVDNWLTRLNDWPWARLEAERQRFSQVYKPISILPPDQYLALVLQATEGCSYNECSFCTFYRDRTFRIQSSSAFATHIDHVRDFFGRGERVRKTLFLADANAVIIPQPRLLPLLDMANDAFPVLPLNLSAQERKAWRAAHPWHLNGIYAFVSAPDALRKEASDFAAMRVRNVRRLYVGLESGHDPLRHFLRKEGTAEDVVDAVRAIKAGGVDVGLICMVGIGGEQFREAHFRDTVALLQRMPVDGHDLIYLSPFVAAEDSPYVQDALNADIEALSTGALQAEEVRFRQALQPRARELGVRISRYDIREFIY